MGARQRARLIYNPSSGKEAMRARLATVLDILEDGGLETSCHATKSAADTRAAARLAALDGFDLVIAAGGDGTVHEVVNGLAGMEHRPTLGILPAGTTNDLARALNLPFRLEEACRVIVERRTQKLDVGVFGDRHFVNIAGCGRLTTLTFEVPSKLKTVLGQLAYYVKGLERLPMLRPIPLHIDSPELQFSGGAMLCLIGNSNSVGGFTRLLPSARLDDGCFDVLLVKEVNLAEFVRLTTMAFRGEHILSDNVVYVQTPRIRIWSEEAVDLNLDGEYGGQLPCEFSMLPQHLDVIVGTRVRLSGARAMILDRSPARPADESVEKSGAAVAARLSESIESSGVDVEAVHVPLVEALASESVDSDPSRTRAARPMLEFECVRAEPDDAAVELGKGAEEAEASPATAPGEDVSAGDTQGEEDP